MNAYHIMFSTSISRLVLLMYDVVGAGLCNCGLLNENRGRAETGISSFVSHYHEPHIDSRRIYETRLVANEQDGDEWSSAHLKPRQHFGRLARVCTGPI